MHATVALLFSIFSERILPNFLLSLAPRRPFRRFCRGEERGGNGGLGRKGGGDGRRMEEGKRQLAPNRLSLLREQTRRRNEPRGCESEDGGRIGGRERKEAVVGRW